MSYILDALKRLEQDKAAFRKGRNPLETLVEPDPVPDRRPRRRLYPGVGLGFALVLGLAVIAVHWIARDSGPESTSPTQALSAANPAFPPLRPGTAEKARTRGAPDQALQDPGPADRELLPMAPATNAVHASRKLPAEAREPLAPPATLPRAPSPNRTETGSRRNLPAAEEQAVGREDTGDWERLPMRPSQEEVPANPAGKVYPNGAKDGIKISAIVWSAEKANRFAMINLKTVYEGDSIDGKGIVEIQQDGIVFMEGNDQYKILLGGR